MVWNANSGQRVRLLQEFAQTELDSAWQSLFALERVPDRETRALLFNHALEEIHHSELFTNLAAQKARAIPVLPLTRREPLLPLENPTLKDSVEFLAFLSIGESEIRKDFRAYQRAISDKPTSDLFRTISADEDRHAENSTASLKELAHARGLSLTWVRVRHLASLSYKRYVSVMTKFSAVPITALLFLVYTAFAPLFARQARRRLRLGANDQLEILREQQRTFDAKWTATP